MSITFNGSSYLELSSDLIGAGVGEAFFAWIRPRGVSLSGNSAAVSSGRFGAGSELSMLTIGGATVRAQSRDGTGSGYAEQSRTFSDTWFACLVVFTSTSSRTVYISGASPQTNTDSNDARLPGAHDRFRIGARGYENNLYWEGDIAEVAVWSGTLPDATDFTALAGGELPENIKSGSLIWHRTLESHTDLTAGAAGSTPTANGTLSTGSTHPITRSSGFTITADGGTYTTTGVTADLKATRLITAEVGSYSWSGVDANLVKATPGAFFITADPGSYTITGTDAYRDLAFNAESGIYTATGYDVSFTLTEPMAYSITAEPGAYTFAGRTVYLLGPGDIIPTTKSSKLAINIGLRL